jgi:pimeloyl-ACP methyl ester carboxylesterase
MPVEEISELSALHNPAFPVEYKTASVNGLKVFYREAGPKDAPAILLLHGFPSSSRMFATLLPVLSDKYHVIAPDYPGFGHSDSPSPEAFAFDHLAACMSRLVEQLGVTRYALYLQDYGGPVGFRLAVAHPERVTAIIIQNAVVHLEGLSEAWEVRKAFWQDRAAHEEKLRQALLSIEVARQRHVAGVSHPERIDPDTWSDEFAFLTKPGMTEFNSISCSTIAPTSRPTRSGKPTCASINRQLWSCVETRSTFYCLWSLGIRTRSSGRRDSPLER